MENNKCEHCAKHKHRTEKEYKSLVNRLNRIEGQIRGIKGMLEKTPTVPIFWYRLPPPMRHSTLLTKSCLLIISAPALQMT